VRTGHAAAADRAAAIKKRTDDEINHFPVGQNLDGKLGQGGPEIELSTVNGGIHIDRSKAVALEDR